MTRVVIVIGEDGVYDTVFADSETDVRILIRGADDCRIDEAEHSLEEVTTA